MMDTFRWSEYPGINKRIAILLILCHRYVHVQVRRHDCVIVSVRARVCVCVCAFVYRIHSKILECHDVYFIRPYRPFQ